MNVMTPVQRDALDAAGIALAESGVRPPGRCTHEEMMSYFNRKFSLAARTIAAWNRLGVKRLWTPRRRTMIQIAVIALRVEEPRR